MVINDFNVVRVSFMPSEADSPPVIDTNAELSLSVTTQYFQPVAGRHAKRFNFDCGIQHIKFPQCDAFNGFKTPAFAGGFQLSGVRTVEAFDHEKYTCPFSTI
jgi:hypothetical protein